MVPVNRARSRLPRAADRRRPLLLEQLEDRRLLARDLLLADHATDSILRFDGATGAPLGNFVAPNAGGLVDPHDPTFGPDGNLYLFSGPPTARKILKFDGATGAFESTFVAFGPTGYIGGSDMTFGPDGHLYVATGADAVLKYNGATGAGLGFAAQGQGLRRTLGVNFGSDGLLYVLDADTSAVTVGDRIVRFDTAGALVDTFVPAGVLQNAAQFTFGPDRHLYVPDLTLGAVYQFSGATGELIKHFRDQANIATSPGFQIAGGSDGRAYVATGHEILRYDIETGAFEDVFISTVGGSIALMPATPATNLAVTNVQTPNGAALDRSLRVSYAVQNQSQQEAAAGWDDVVYLSTDLHFDPSDVELARVRRTTPLGGSFEYSQSIEAQVPAIPPGDYYAIVVVDRRGETADSNRANNFAVSEAVEIVRPLAASHNAAQTLAIGRQLSAYSTNGLEADELTINYTVFNLLPGQVTGALFTTTLAADVTLVNASLPPQRNGAQLAWNLGDLAPYESVTIEVRVARGDSQPLVLDERVLAFGTLDATFVSDDLPSAVLRTDALDPTWLADTEEAQGTDRYIRAKAAELDHDPFKIFAFLRDSVAYESYLGSLRGARGALWSAAGNALDQSSLMIALLRASGIPARYARGELSPERARELTATMFPPMDRIIGQVTDPTIPISAPLDDAALLAEARDHVWVEIALPEGVVSADPTMPHAELDQTFASATEQFVAPHESLRHQIAFRMVREMSVPAGNILGFGVLARTTMLDVSLFTAELVGRPLSFGQLVDSGGISTFITAISHYYHPYMLVGEPGDDPLDGLYIQGESYQELITNFPLSTQVLTGVYLEMDVWGPGHPLETHYATLFDRIGRAPRLHGGNVSLPPFDTTRSAITSGDITTVNVLPNLQSVQPVFEAAQRLAEIQTETAAFLQSHLDVSTSALLRDLDLLSRRSIITTQRIMTMAYAARSDSTAASAMEETLVKAYYDSPRLTLARSIVAADESGAPRLQHALDLRKDNIRAIALPGQSVPATYGFQTVRGFANNHHEGHLLGQLLNVPTVYTGRVFDAAGAQGVPLVPIHAGNLAELEALPISAAAKVLIADAVARARLVVVPAQNVVLDGQPTVGWFEYDGATGAVMGVMENGLHAGLAGQGGQKGNEAAFYAVMRHIGEAFAGALFGIQLGFVAPLLAGFTHTLANLYLSRPENLAAWDASKYWIVLFMTGFGYGKSDNFKNIVKKIPGSPTFKIAFAIGFVSGAANAGIWASRLTKQDPGLPSDVLFGLSGPDDFPQRDSALVNAAPTLPAGNVAGDVTSNALQVSRDFSAQWQSTAEMSLTASSLSAAETTVRDGQGNLVGFGLLSLSGVQQPLLLTGELQVALSGRGSLSTYAGATPGLGIAAEWDSFSGTLTGAGVATLTSAALSLNGFPLPQGTYSVEFTQLALGGSGRAIAPNFVGALTIDASDAAVTFGATADTLPVDGEALPADGLTLIDFVGTLNVTAGADVDLISVAGTAAHSVRIATIAPITLDQNTPATLAIPLSASNEEEYELLAEAPPGWTVQIGADGLLTVTAPPGAQDVTGVVQLVAQSIDNPRLVAARQFEVHAAATEPAVTIDVVFDPVFFIPTNGAQAPTAYLAHIRNLGPAIDTFELTFPATIPGFELATSASTIQIGAGKTAVVGLYLRPAGVIPAAGTAQPFEVTVTSQNDPGIVASTVVNFVTPLVHGVTLVADKLTIGTTPGEAVPVSLVITATGNVPENVTWEVLASTGLEIAGLAPLSLAPGEAQTLSLTVTPLVGTELNTNLFATITAHFGTLNPVLLDLSMRIAAPGADAAVETARLMQSLGNDELAARLGDLSLALTNLSRTPGDPIYRNQVIAQLDSIMTQFAREPLLADFVDDLEEPRETLAISSQPINVLAAITQLGAVFDTIAATLAARIKYKFDLIFLNSSAVAQPLVPTPFEISLRNGGTEPATYNIRLAGLPSGVTGEVSHTQVTLAPGQFAAGLRAMLTQTSTDELLPFNFQAIVSAAAAPLVSESITGSMTLRREFLAVSAVTVTPPFTEAGPEVTVGARLFNAVNRPLPIKVSFIVKNSSGDTVFAAPAVAATLTVQSSLQTINNLGTFSTTGFSNGEYTVEVLVTNQNDQPLPGGSGSGRLLIGSPVTASLASTPEAALPGDRTVTSSLVLNAEINSPPPLTALAQLPLGGAASIVASGNIAYIAGAAGISVVDISDPAHPQLIRTVGAAATTLEVRGDQLVAVRGPDLPSLLFVYSLADPLNPVLLAEEGFDYSRAGAVALTDTHAIFGIGQYCLQRIAISPWDVVQQSGDLISVNLSDPANPALADVLFNTFGTAGDGLPEAPCAISGGPNLVFGITQANDTTLLVPSTTTAGGDTVNGVGRLLIVDIADPNNLEVATHLDIPGTVNIFGVAIDGNRALVTGTSQGFRDNFFGEIATGFYPLGNIVVTMLDITDPRAPQVIGSHSIATSPRGLTGPVALGDQRFAFARLGLTTETPELYFVDASIPSDMIVIAQPSPTQPTGAVAVGGHLFAVEGTGLTVYEVGHAETVPVEVSVPVPQGTGVSLVPGSFNLAPTITEGEAFDTLTWNVRMHLGRLSQTLTWQTLVDDLLPEEIRTISLPSSVNFTSQGTPGELSLPERSVAGLPVMSITPAALTRAPGSSAFYTINLENRTAENITYQLSVTGVPPEWVSMPSSVLVGAGLFTTVGVQLTSDHFDPLGTYHFVVTATAPDHVTTAQAAFTLAGAPVLPPAQLEAYGAVVTLTPQQLTVGRGGTTAATLRVTNTGSVAETFDLASFIFVQGLTATFDQPSILVPPGAENYREVLLRVAASETAATGVSFFSYQAVSENAGMSSSAFINVSHLGVAVDLTPETGPAGMNYFLNVNNTGTTRETFDLSLSGPVALFAELGQTSVTLDPGEGIGVPITVADIDFAFPGPLVLGGTARARTAAQISASDVSQIIIGDLAGGSVAFNPPETSLPAPGRVPLVFEITNLGNLEEEYVVSIVSQIGPIDAALRGPDGTLVQTIPVIRLPGLSTGIVIVDANLFDIGAATVAVSVYSRTRDVLIGDATALILVGEFDYGDAPESYGTSLATGGPRHLPFGPTLGTLRDTEFDAVHPLDGAGDGADEDGVTFRDVATGAAILVPGRAAQATVTINSSLDNARLFGWIDFNRDGDFDDAGEQVANGAAALADGVHVINFIVPAGASLGTTFARFRVGHADNLTATSLALDGEVEDYALEIAQSNRAPTDIGLSRLVVFADLPGAWIAELTVIDPDGGDAHTITFSDDRFIAVNGQLYLKPGVAIDRALETSIALDITATDNGAPPRSLTKQFVLTVLARPADWDCAYQWKPQPLDVNVDGTITPLDAVLIINEINARGQRNLPPTAIGTVAPPFWDVSCDNTVNALDIVLIVNHLNATGGGEGEPETAGELPLPGEIPSLLDDEVRYGAPSVDFMSPLGAGRATDSPLRSPYFPWWLHDDNSDLHDFAGDRKTKAPDLTLWDRLLASEDDWWLSNGQ